MRGMPWTIPNLLLHDKPVPLSNQRSLGYECFARSATTAVQMSAQPGMSRDEKEHEQLGGDFDVAHILFVAVRRPHTEREGFRHARNVAAE
jgi:hypothetical protein